MVQALNVRYLWIDSLCIIQDSQNDWSHEAACMDVIYSNSYCNVAAAQSIDPSVSIIHPRDPHAIGKFEVKVKVLQRSTDKSKQDGLASFVLHCDEMKELDDAPLFQRGWVLQERLLSPRQLIFGKHQVMWQCWEEEACEATPMVPIKDQWERPSIVPLLNQPAETSTSLSMLKH